MFITLGQKDIATEEHGKMPGNVSIFHHSGLRPNDGINLTE
jgi:hypothetical protein